MFVDTGHCRSRVHCPACRDPGPAGRAFRKSLARVFDVPPGLFPCPFNECPDPLPEPERVSPDIIAARQAACAACEYYRGVSNECGRLAVRCSACFFKSSTSKCPAGAWPQ